MLLVVDGLEWRLHKMRSRLVGGRVGVYGVDSAMPLEWGGAYQRCSVPGKQKRRDVRRCGDCATGPWPRHTQQSLVHIRNRGMSGYRVKA